MLALPEDRCDSSILRLHWQNHDAASVLLRFDSLLRFCVWFRVHPTQSCARGLKTQRRRCVQTQHHAWMHRGRRRIPRAPAPGNMNPRLHFADWIFAAPAEGARRLQRFTPAVFGEHRSRTFDGFFSPRAAQNSRRNSTSILSTRTNTVADKLGTSVVSVSVRSADRRRGNRKPTASATKIRCKCKDSPSIAPPGAEVDPRIVSRRRETTQGASQ